MIFDSKRPMTPDERMAYDLGRAESNAELAALREQVARLQAERDAAAKDLRRLSDEFKFCRTCLYDHGSGIDDCHKYDCDMENRYEWRGLCADNAPEGGNGDG